MVDFTLFTEHFLDWLIFIKQLLIQCKILCTRWKIFLGYIIYFKLIFL